jgi:hypothetical protein
MNTRDWVELLLSVSIFASGSLLLAVELFRRAVGMPSLFMRRLARGMQESLLDTVLMTWTPGDDLTLRGLLNGGVVMLGRPGSGKSSSSSRQLLKSCVDQPHNGGLILGASPSDLPLMQELFGNQEERLLIFDERSKFRFNAINYMLACGGSTKDIATGIDAIAETVGRSGVDRGRSGEDGSFFTIGARRIIENAVVVVKHATGGGTLVADLLKFINTAASSPQEFHTSEEFKKCFHYECLRKAHEKEKSPVETYDNDLAFSFFAQELPRMADRTRTSLIAVVMNTLHGFNSGTNRLLFATETNISPMLLDQGKWIFVNMPVSRSGQEGGFALGVWKFMTEWHTLRRDSSRNNPPLIIHADEFHNIVNSYDTRFLGECRKFRGCMIACSQSKASFYANMGGEAAEAQVDAMLNNFTHKIIHALGDIKTAEWASQLVGSRMQFSLGGSETSPQFLLDELLGRGIWNGSMSETMRPVMEPREFMHGFRTGGKLNDYLCDAILIRSGEPFKSNGENFLRLAFSQK